jgi:hypothetical protein
MLLARTPHPVPSLGGLCSHLVQHFPYLGWQYCEVSLALQESVGYVAPLTSSGYKPFIELVSTVETSSRPLAPRGNVCFPDPTASDRFDPSG